MKRRILTYGGYFEAFMATLKEKEQEKIQYGLLLLKTQDRLSTKFIKLIKDGLYELRTEYGGNIFRVFFIFDEGKIVVLFNGFQKKSQKTPSKEIEKAFNPNRSLEPKQILFYCLVVLLSGCLVVLLFYCFIVCLEDSSERSESNPGRSLGIITEEKKAVWKTVPDNMLLRLRLCPHVLKKFTDRF